MKTVNTLSNAKNLANVIAKALTEVVANNNRTPNNNTLITSANAPYWAAVYEEIERINSLSTVDEFYGVIEPIFGIREVYDRLTGWRKEVYKDYIMSGSIVFSQYGNKRSPDNWGWGKYRPHIKKAIAVVAVYGDYASDWSDFEEHSCSLNWEEVCDLYKLP